jgi:hypothetical protein
LKGRASAISVFDISGENLCALGWTDDKDMVVLDRSAEGLPTIIKHMISSGVAVLVAGTLGTLADTMKTGLSESADECGSEDTVTSRSTERSLACCPGARTGRHCQVR